MVGPLKDAIGAEGFLVALIALFSVLDHPDAASAPIMALGIDQRSGVYSRNGGETNRLYHQTSKRGGGDAKIQ
jgi:hypothetical protein